MGLFSNIKDDFTAASAKMFIRKKIERYGKLLGFDVNSSEKTIFISVMLDGENKPIELNIKKYVIINESPAKIEFKEIESNREWITRAAMDYIKDRKFTLPQNISPIIKLLL